MGFDEDVCVGDLSTILLEPVFCSFLEEIGFEIYGLEIDSISCFKGRKAELLEILKFIGFAC